MKKIFIYGDPEQRRNYAEAVSFCGGEPVISEKTEESASCAGLLLSGGGDVDPGVYGAINTMSTGIDPRRDADELLLIREFLRSCRPILGICRGHQILNAALGGELLQDLGELNEAHKWDEAKGDRVHLIRVTRESFLFPLYGEEFPVNSAHHQAVSRPGAGMTVTAVSPEGIVEASQDPERKLYTVQWHPERMTFHKAREDTVDGQKVFRSFIDLC